MCTDRTTNKTKINPRDKKVDILYNISVTLVGLSPLDMWSRGINKKKWRAASKSFFSFFLFP